MSAHRLAEERSIAYHRAIVEKMDGEPGILERARARVAEWERATPRPPYARSWKDVLARDPEAVAAFLVERSPLADELRQSSPFGGVLDPRERWRIWQATRDRLASES